MNRRIRGENSCGMKIAVATMTLCGLAFLSGCDGLDLSDLVDLVGSSGGTEPPPSEIDVTGTWSVAEVDSSNCDDSGATRTTTWNVTQNGSSVTVTAIGSNAALTGTITGNTINLQGSFPEDGGITTVTSTTITVSATGNSISGSETWTWSDGFDFCFGTTSVTGSRQ